MWGLLRPGRVYDGGNWKKENAHWLDYKRQTTSSSLQYFSCFEDATTVMKNKLFLLKYAIAITIYLYGCFADKRLIRI